MSVSTDSAVQAIQHGAADFILKPVPSNTLQLLWQHVYRRHVHASDNAGGDGGKAKAKNVRVTWTPQLHALFVAAVQKLGIDQAVPKEIKKVMGVSALKRQQIARRHIVQVFEPPQALQGRVAGLQLGHRRSVSDRIIGRPLLPICHPGRAVERRPTPQRPIAR